MDILMYQSYTDSDREVKVTEKINIRVLRIMPDLSCSLFNSKNVFPNLNELYTVACSPTDAALVYGRRVQEIGLKSSKSGHASSVICGDFSPDVKTIYTGSDDASLRVWNSKTRENVHVKNGHPYHTEGLTCLVISSDSSHAITGSKDGSFYLMNLIPGKDGVACLAWLGSSRCVVTGGLDGKVRVWDSLSEECAKAFNGHAHAIQSLSASANLDFLISVSIDQTAQVLEIA
ncbi:hypothetical protein MKX03_012244 [Papaver bracteatum]|nr:hypothetical protein MKX03_012244 [Papaver bracteatum]